MKKRIIIYVAVGLCLLIGGIIFFMIADRNTNIAVNSNGDDVELNTGTEKSAAETEREAEDLEMLREILGDLYTDEEILNGGKKDGDDAAEDVVDEPTITVLTEIPDGETDEAIINIEYEVTPSRAARISEIYYTINDDIERQIYSEDKEDNESKLSKGKLFLVDGENEIVFYVVDSRNKTAQFKVESKPYLIEPERPIYDENMLRPSKFGDGVQYVSNWIIVSFGLDIQDEKVLEIVDSIDGDIAGKGALNTYFILLPESTEEELEAICEHLEKEYEGVVSYADVNYTVDKGLIYASTNDPWWAEEPERDSNPALDEQKTRMFGEIILTEDSYKEWKLPYRQWGLGAINAPAAWELMSGQIDNVNVGIVDSSIRETHEDLEDLQIFTYEGLDGENDVEGEDEHGTHVMGTISAIHNNKTGISGVIDIEPRLLYSYDSSNPNILDDSEIREGLYDLVQRNVRVINISQQYYYGNSKAYEDIIADLRTLDNDFLIVLAAGNDAMPASDNMYAKVEKEELANHIMVVGASTPPYDPEDPGTYAVADFSNYGERIDVMAPGVRIFSTTSSDYYADKPDGSEDPEEESGNPKDNLEVRYDDDNYMMMEGISMAAPHVTGIAAMVYLVNPELTAADVKRIIKESATKEVIEKRGDVLLGDYTSYYMADAEAAVQMAIASPMWKKPYLYTVLAEQTGLFETTHKLAWGYQKEYADQITGYEIYRSTDPADGFALLTTVAGDDPDLETFIYGDEFPENIASYSLTVNDISGDDYYYGEFQL